MVAGDHLDLDTGSLTRLDGGLYFGSRRIHDANEPEEDQIGFNGMNVFNVLTFLDFPCKERNHAHRLGTHVVVHLRNLLPVNVGQGDVFIVHNFGGGDVLESSRTSFGKDPLFTLVLVHDTHALADRIKEEFVETRVAM